MSILNNLFDKLINYIDEKTKNSNGDDEVKPIIKGFSKPQRNPIIFTNYKVKGINPKTGRIKTVRVADIENATNESVIRKSRLLEPCRVEHISDPEPSESQYEYARDLGIRIPKDATSMDVSIFLRRYEDKKPIYQASLSLNILQQCLDLGIYIPKYAGINEFNMWFFTDMSKENKLAYFAMKVYSTEKNKKYCFMNDALEIEREIFEKFSQKYIKDEDFIAKFNNDYHIYTEILVLENIKKKNTETYKIAKNYLELSLI